MHGSQAECHGAPVSNMHHREGGSYLHIGDQCGHGEQQSLMILRRHYFLVIRFLRLTLQCHFKDIGCH
ncbi:hypothetical protein D3C81_2206510 [compost metagenome]